MTAHRNHHLAEFEIRAALTWLDMVKAGPVPPQTATDEARGCLAKADALLAEIGQEAGR